MRKISLFISLILLFGCEKYVGTESNPQLNINGGWDVIKIEVKIDEVNYEGKINPFPTNINEASISSFYVNKINSDGTLSLSQNYDEVSVDKRFNVNKTNWKFDYNKLRIYENLENVTKGDYIFITFPCSYCTKKTVLEWDYMGTKTIYTFNVDTYGAMPANELILTSQQFVTNILLNGNTYDKALISHLVITFHRGHN
jgi:hypothetical protein